MGMSLCYIEGMEWDWKTRGKLELTGGIEGHWRVGVHKELVESNSDWRGHRQCVHIREEQ